MRNRHISSGRKISAKQLSICCLQMAALTGSGIPVAECFLLAGSTFGREKQEQFNHAAQDIENGFNIPDALKRNITCLPPSFVPMIDAGIHSDNLEKTFRYLGNHYRKEWRLEEKIQKSLLYPLILLCCIIVVLIVMLGYVIPGITALYKNTGTDLPGITVAVIRMSEWFRKWWIPAALVIAVAIIVWILCTTKTDSGRKAKGVIQLRFPFLGTINRLRACIEFCSLLSAMLSAGIHEETALRLTASSMGNPIIKQEVTSIAGQVNEGQKLSDCLHDIRYFPDSLYTFCRTGEESGMVSDMLRTAAGFYGIELDRKVQSAVSALEPLLIIMLGAVVGILAASVYLPVLRLVDSI